ncbi:uncharacterized protein ARMOST_21313 [Armillaria ostoyae]|uniref:Uncharacterized protein n=1 Tax=Armillaria ostoyae TaxID=47428 RepID=A0A284S9S6_ARMOS|nr:uncharacterized protein ARMOST_21313 [Armillaria ostoyae]
MVYSHLVLPKYYSTCSLTRSARITAEDRSCRTADKNRRLGLQQMSRYRLPADLWSFLSRDSEELCDWREDGHKVGQVRVSHSHALGDSPCNDHAKGKKASGRSFMLLCRCVVSRTNRSARRKNQDLNVTNCLVASDRGDRLSSSVNGPSFSRRHHRRDHRQFGVFCYVETLLSLRSEAKRLALAGEAVQWSRTIIIHADTLLKICYPFANAERSMPHYRQPLLQSVRIRSRSVSYCL